MEPMAANDGGRWDSVWYFFSPHQIITSLAVRKI